jgi:hypothetical protein
MAVIALERIDDTRELIVFYPLGLCRDAPNPGEDLG